MASPPTIKISHETLEAEYCAFIAQVDAVIQTYRETANAGIIALTRFQSLLGNQTMPLGWRSIQEEAIRRVKWVEEKHAETISRSRQLQAEAAVYLDRLHRYERTPKVDDKLLIGCETLLKRSVVMLKEMDQDASHTVVGCMESDLAAAIERLDLLK